MPGDSTNSGTYSITYYSRPGVCPGRRCQHCGQPYPVPAVPMIPAPFYPVNPEPWAQPPWYWNPSNGPFYVTATGTVN